MGLMLSVAMGYLAWTSKDKKPQQRKPNPIPSSSCQYPGPRQCWRTWQTNTLLLRRILENSWLESLSKTTIKGFWCHRQYCGNLKNDTRNYFSTTFYQSDTTMIHSIQTDDHTYFQPKHDSAHSEYRDLKYQFKSSLSGIVVISYQCDLTKHT